MYTYDENIVRDLHKDAYGFRPSRFWMEVWSIADADRKQKIWDELIVHLNEEIDREKAAAVQAVSEFQDEIENMMDSYGCDYTTALRWMIQTDKYLSPDEYSTHTPNIQDAESWVWARGMLFTNYGRQVVKDIMAIIEA